MGHQASRDQVRVHHDRQYHGMHDSMGLRDRGAIWNHRQLYVASSPCLAHFDDSDSDHSSQVSSS